MLHSTQYIGGVQQREVLPKLINQMVWEPIASRDFSGFILRTGTGDTVLYNFEVQSRLTFSAYLLCAWNGIDAGRTIKHWVNASAVGEAYNTWNMANNADYVVPAGALAILLRPLIRTFVAGDLVAKDLLTIGISRNSVGGGNGLLIAGIIFI